MSIRLRTLSFFLLIFACSSCKKDRQEQSIKEFDQQQIENYIRDNNLTGMVRDTAGGDTTGIYYQILLPGKGKQLEYYNKASYVYKLKSFNGEWSFTDTISNHVSTYVGYVSPSGLQLALKFGLKNSGGRIRVLVPSHLAYGKNGITTGTNKLKGNQCLDYTITVVDDQSQYDEISIKSYMKTYNLSGYTRLPDGIYYKIIKKGTGTDPVTVNSEIGVQYTGYLLNQSVFDQANSSDGTAAATLFLDDLIDGWKETLPLIRAGGKISVIIPSEKAYKSSGSSSVPPFSCLRFEINLIDVTN